MKQVRYTNTAIVLHWLKAIVLITLFSVSLYMHELPLSRWKLLTLHTDAMGNEFGQGLSEGVLRDYVNSISID